MPLINVFQESITPSSFVVNLNQKLDEMGLNSVGPFWASLTVKVINDISAEGFISGNFKYTDASQTEQSQELVLSLSELSVKSTSVFCMLRDSVASDFKVEFTLISGNIGNSKISYFINLIKF